MFDPAWEQQHAEREWGTVPSEHLVRFVKRAFPGRHAVPFRAIDLGCGAGAQSAFLQKEGFLVTAVDGSESAIRRVSTKCLFALVSDIATVEFEPAHYDLVVDVCTLQHQPRDVATKIVERVAVWLKPGGWFFSIMAAPLFSLDCAIQPRVISDHDLKTMFSSQWRLQFGRETIGRPEGGRTDHFIIEAQCA